MFGQILSKRFYVIIIIYFFFLSLFNFKLFSLLMSFSYELYIKIDMNRNSNNKIKPVINKSLNNEIVEFDGDDNVRVKDGGDYWSEPIYTIPVKLTK